MATPEWLRPRSKAKNILGKGFCSAMSLKPKLVMGFQGIASNITLMMIEESQARPGLWWSGQKNERFGRKWAGRPAQTVNSPEYKELKQYIHMPYRKLDHNQTKCFYFPTYVVFKIKNITEFDFESLSASINGVLIIHIRVDYRSSEAPEDNDYEELRVARALEKLFNVRIQDVDKKDDFMGETMNSKFFNESFKGSREDKEEEDLELKKYLYIQFNRDNPLRLPAKRVFEGQIKLEPPTAFSKEEGLILKWTIRKEFTISLAPGTYFEDLIAPFNLLNFKLTLSFEDVDLELPSKADLLEMGHSKRSLSDKSISEGGGREQAKFKFNCMKRVGNNSLEEQRRIFEQLMFTDDGSLGEYDLAETGLNVQCEKYLSKVQTTEEAGKYRAFKVVTFTIPFYKYPIMDALTIFIPLVLITILTLFTFFQGPDFNDKIGNIATLMIVYVGLMPVINDSLPPTTKITLIDLVLYCQLLISVLCLIRGYQVKDYSPTQFDAYRVWEDPMYLFCIVVAALTAIVLLLLLVYYCVMKAWYYNLEESDIDESDKKLAHWVSPHMHSEARRLKMELQKAREQREKREKEDKGQGQGQGRGTGRNGEGKERRGNE